MAKKKSLTPQQERFVAQYIIDLNATQAAIRAGYSKKSASTLGYQLLQKPLVREAIDEGLRRKAARARLSADRTLEELGRIATLDPRRFFYSDQDERDNDTQLEEQAGPDKKGVEGGTSTRARPRVRVGNVKPPHEWRPQEAAAVAAYDVVTKSGGAYGQQATIVKLRFCDKVKALELMAKHLGMLTEKKEERRTYQMSWLPPEGDTLEGDSVAPKGAPRRGLAPRVDCGRHVVQPFS